MEATAWCASCLYGAEVGQAAVATRCGRAEPSGGDRSRPRRGVAVGDVAEEAAGWGRRAPARQRWRRRGRWELIVLLPAPAARRAEAAEDRPSRVSSLSPRALDWVAPIRARRSLTRCRGDLDCSPCSVITEVMRNTNIEKFLIALEPLIRRVVRPPFVFFITVCLLRGQFLASVRWMKILRIE
jgi:hypothetical protein